MCYLSNICFICLKDIDKLHTVYLNTTEDAVKQMKYVLPEITLEPEIPVHICSTCHTKLHSFCTFKKQCLENYCLFIKKLRESGNAKVQLFNAFQIEIENIKGENQVDADLTNEAPDKFNSQINFVTNKDTIKEVQDEIISPGLNKNINEESDSDMTDDIKTFEFEEQHDQRNNFIKDNIYIKEDIIIFKDSEEQNLYQELLSDIKKEIDSEEDINEIESTVLYFNNSEHAVSNLIVSPDLNQNINEESDIKEEIKSFGCKICSKKFTRRNDLDSHIKVHFGIQCSICKKKFKHNSYLKIHMKTHTGAKDFFKCSICEKKFTQNNSLKLHMKIHTGVKNFQCFVCEKKFTQKCNLVMHVKTHSDVKDFQCSICEKRFTQSSSQKLHMKIHTGVKDFQCFTCNKKFTRKCNLDRHIKLHTGLKDFHCSICEKKFVYNSNLKLHMKTHIGVKDLQCSICEKKFMLKCNLNMHMKIHTGVKDFHCSICEKKFVVRSHLNYHMKIHTGVKDFQCSICEKKFILNSHLKRHINTHSRI